MSGHLLVMLAAEAGGEEASNLLRLEQAAVILLAIAAGVAVLASRLRFPFTVALVLAGFGAALLGDLVEVDVSPDLILGLLVPPLLFEATLHLPWKKLRADLRPVLTSAIVGTLIGTLAVGAVVHAVLDIPWAAAFAFGALISATDPVAVIAFFKALGTPKRLSVLVEGESLFNDAVAVVAFGLALSAAGGEAFSLGGAIEDFLVVSLGGLGVGLVLGYIVSEIVLARVDDGLIETTTTMALAYGAYLIAESAGEIVGRSFHFSGILAVVAAGLTVGSLGLKNTSPNTRQTLEHSWELLTFLVNSLVFLFIGLTISLTSLLDHAAEVILAVVTVLVVRVVVVYGLTAFANLTTPERRISPAFQHVMFWGGLRGAISLALALLITEDLFEPDTVESLQVMTFGVVVFTLLIQGTTMGPLIQRLGLAGRADNELAQQHHQAKIMMARAGQDEMNRLGSQGVLFSELADALAVTYQRQVSTEGDRLRTHLRDHPELEVAMLLQARRDALIAELGALSDVVRSGLVEQQVADSLSVDTSNRLAALELLEERWEAGPQPDEQSAVQHGTPGGAQ